MKKCMIITLFVLMSVKANAQGGVGKFLTNYSIDGKDEIKTSSNIGFVRDGEADRYSWQIDWNSQNNNMIFDEFFDIKNVKSIFRYVESDNQLTVNIPSNINPNDVIVQAYGQEITPTNNHIYSTGASTVSVLNKNGKTIYECYISIDTIDAQRTIEVNAMETAYSMLIPLFPFALDPTSDEILATLKSLLAELSETHALATAIEKSVVKNGYFEIDEVSSELNAAANRIIEKLGLRDNYLKQSPKKAPSKTSSKFPTVIDGKRHFGLELNLDYSEWNTKERRWQCHFTAYNSNRFAYTGWTKGYKDSEGYAHLYDIDYDLFKKRILKPQRVSTFMKNITTWEGMKEYWSETYRLFTDEDFGFEDMKWDNTKKSFDLEFYNENDIVVVLGPADDDLMLYYHFMKSILEAPAKKIAKKIFDAEDDDYMLNLCIDLLADEDFRTQFKMIYNDNLYSYGKKSVEIFKLVWPKFEKQLKEKIEDDIQFCGILYVWTRYGIKDALQLDNAFEEFSKNWNKWLKMVEFWGDLGLGILGLQEGNLYYNLDLNFDIEQIPVSKETFTVNGVKFDMVKVEGGTFQMGANDNDKEASSSEKPRHQVSLSNYYIGETEVTQALWKAVMGSNPSQFNGTELPVDNVSWLDCQEFITKLNALTGRSFRLPTEAEWEYAARGGQNNLGHKYAGSHNIEAVAWYKENSTHPVRWKQANELGLYDMSGNVMEWCQDFYDVNYYQKSPEEDPCNDVTADLFSHAIRGGSWNSEASYCRVTARRGNAQAVKSEIFGLRLAMDENTHPNKDGQIVMERKYKVHHGGNYHEPQIILDFGNKQVLHVGYLKMNWWGDYSHTKHGIHIIAGDDWSKANEENVWYIAPTIADEWVTEKLIVDLDGKVQYYMNGQYMGEKTFTGIDLSNAKMVSIQARPFGWWTGHSHYMDDFSLTTPFTSISDDFNDGVLDTNIWLTPVNPDGVREEDGILKMEMLRTDQDFDLRSKPIPLFEEEILELCPDNNHPHTIDLGLPSGALWACCNVGATKPEENGDYFAWGETEPKENYSWGTYKWCNGNQHSMNKYCYDSAYGIIDNKTVLELEDDAAYMIFGSEWRMPTKEEQDEFRENCDWEWTIHKGVMGMKVKSRKNDVCVFLPACGYRSGNSKSYVSEYGYYQSASLDMTNSDDSYYFYFNSAGHYWQDFSTIVGRDVGFSVRPVRMSNQNSGTGSGTGSGGDSDGSGTGGGRNRN